MGGEPCVFEGSWRGGFENTVAGLPINCILINQPVAARLRALRERLRSA